MTAVTEGLVERLRRLDKETDATRFGYLKLAFHATNEQENLAFVGGGGQPFVLNMRIREVEELLQAAKDVFYALPALLRLAEAAESVERDFDTDYEADHSVLFDALAALKAKR